MNAGPLVSTSWLADHLDDPALRISGARHLAILGDRRGFETIIRLCGEQPAPDSEPRRILASLLVRPGAVDEFDSVAQWYEVNKGVIEFQETARWKGKGAE